jgi:hypothetical protein
MLDGPENQVTVQENFYVIETAIVKFTVAHLLFQCTSYEILWL